MTIFNFNLTFSFLAFQIGTSEKPTYGCITSPPSKQAGDQNTGCSNPIIRSNMLHIRSYG